MKFNSQRFYRVIVDVLLVVFLIISVVSTSVFEDIFRHLKHGANLNEVLSWKEVHCVISIFLTALMVFHIQQHWAYLLNIFKRKKHVSEIIILLVLLFFVLTVISYFLYLSGFTEHKLHFHSLAAHLLLFLLVIHIITKAKKFINLLK